MRLVSLLIAWNLILPIVAEAAGPAPDGGDPTGAGAAQVQTRPLYPGALEQVKRLRGWKESQPIQVDYVSNEEVERRSIEINQLAPEALAQLQARWVAFGLIERPLDLAAFNRANAQRVGVVYDFKHHRLVVAETLPNRAGWGDGYDTAQPLLAQTIEQALQDQAFGGPGVQPTAEADLATRAIYGGDATFVMFSAFAEPLPSEGPEALPASHLVLNNMSRMAESAGRALASFGRGGASPQQPAVGLIEEAVFAHFGGARFLNALFRTGGLELMNKAFQARPTTTEQIIHPDKYLAGEQPIPVPVPRLPSGHTELASGTLGELETRILLGFASWEWAKLAASGWGGDSFLISRGPDGLVTLQWNTVWDSAEDAAQFAQLMELVPAKLWRSPGSGDWQVAPSAVVQLRKGKHQVVVVRGVPEEAQRLAAAMAAPGRAPPLQPPLGAIELADDALPDLTASRISKDGWSNYEYGLKSQLPANAQAKIATPGHLLQVRRSDAEGVLWGAIAFKSDPKAKLDALVERAKSENHLAGRVRKTSESVVTVAGAKGRQRDVVLDGAAEAGLRALVWPTCSGSAQFSAVVSWSTAKARGDALAWLESIQATGFDAPICVPPEKLYHF